MSLRPALTSAFIGLLLLPANALAADPTVVLMSGLNSSTAFTTADPACAGHEGPTWDDPAGPAAKLRAAGRQVFTVPAGPTGSGSAPAACGSPAPPASMTIDTGGDVDQNGARLLAFLQFLQTNYGVSTVQLVAH